MATLAINSATDLNQYYDQTVIKEGTRHKSDKTRLIVVKDSSGEHLVAKKLSFFERLGALFGGNASLKRVVAFCNDKNIHSEGMAKIVKSYNDTHGSEPITYYYITDSEAPSAHDQCNIKPAFKRAMKAGDLSPLSEVLTDINVADPDFQTKMESYLKKAVKTSHFDIAILIASKLDESRIEPLLSDAFLQTDFKMVRALLPRIASDSLPS